MIKHLPPVVLLFLFFQAASQNISGVINIYTPVTAINACANNVTVASAAGFNVGDEVLLIEM